MQNKLDGAITVIDKLRKQGLLRDNTVDLNDLICELVDSPQKEKKWKEKDEQNRYTYIRTMHILLTGSSQLYHDLKHQF